MYYRNPDYFDVERLSKIASADADSKAKVPPGHPLLSIVLVLVPVLAIFLVVAAARFVG